MPDRKVFQHSILDDKNLLNKKSKLVNKRHQNKLLSNVKRNDTID